MPPPQARSVAPETFLLDQDAQQSLPPDSVVALQQVDNRMYLIPVSSLVVAHPAWRMDFLCTLLTRLQSNTSSSQRPLTGNLISTFAGSCCQPANTSHVFFGKRAVAPTPCPLANSRRNNLFHISGTDIVRCLSFRFQAFGRPVKNSKKFEEGIFSDLRNLKSGTDASLEEPKSAFLDFLYKNNCIRTQKKQKVFYWYSVPHDRLFLDALERDLKREKMGQEATTMAVSEPALSFEFDSSQSLFEQLTKAQQTNSSSFNNQQQQPSYQTTSPDMRGMDSMPPPTMVPVQQPMPQMQQPMQQPIHHEDPMAQYHQQMSMPPTMQNTIVKSREREYSQQMQYDRNGIPLSQVHQRHSSMPAYMEYSPAPSFVSSHYEDYSTRGLSFEPLTPPQHQIGLSAEPAYIANEDTGLYSAIPDLPVPHTFNPLMNIPPSNLMGPGYPGVSRPFQPGNVYSVIEGSPTYKQRRRRSSLSAGIAAAVSASGAAHQVHRPSDLRRSMSSSVVPLAEVDESNHNSPNSANGASYAPQMPDSKPLLDMSRQGTPLNTVEESPEPQPAGLHHDDLNTLVNGELFEAPLQHSALARTAGAAPVFRRARSATMMECGPYPQKSHSCPIPTCGRLFKRLEHLKR
jgi:transcription factor STE12